MKFKDASHPSCPLHSDRAPWPLASSVCWYAGPTWPAMISAMWHSWQLREAGPKLLDTADRDREREREREGGGLACYAPHFIYAKTKRLPSIDWRNLFYALAANVGRLCWTKTGYIVLWLNINSNIRTCQFKVHRTARNSLRQWACPVSCG